MQSDINKIVKWCETWSMELCQLRIVIKKCKEMHLGKKRNQEAYSIAEKKMLKQEQIKELIFVLLIKIKVCLY